MPAAARVQWLRDVSVNDYITFKVSGSGGRFLCVRVTEVTRFPTFDALIRHKGLSRVLPGVADVPDGVSLYRSYASRSGTPYWELERDHGVVAITVVPLH